MKILSVSLYNIASIEGPFHIDFESEPLKSEGLFAITGATGSGKSTILDAICLALYNNTPRLSPIKSYINIGDGENNLSVRDVKTLLRKGAEAAFAKVVFKAIDDKIYASEWKIRRARGYGRIQDEIITLENLSDKTLFPERNKTLVLKEIQRLLGLSFEQFTKSVILAQGEFANFLKATESERADILEKLTGTEIYSKISAQIFQKHKDLQTEITFFDAQLSSIELLTDEEQQTLHLALDQLKEQENQLIAAQKQLQIQLDWHLKNQQLTEQIRQASVNLQIAQEAKNQQQHRFEILDKVEKIQPLKPIWLQKENVQKQIFTVELDIEGFSQKITELQQQAIVIQNALDKEKQHQQTFLQLHEKWLPQIQQARVLDIQIQQKKEILSDKMQQIQAFEQNNQALIGKIEVEKQTLAQIKERINQNKLWQSQNAYFEKFAENYSLIGVSCKEAERAVSEKEKFRKEVEALKGQIHQVEVFVNEEKTKNENLVQQHILAKQAYDEFKKAIKEFDIEKLISEQNEIIQKIEQQKNILNSIQKLQEERQNVQRTQQKKQQKKEQLIQIEQQLAQNQTDVSLAQQEVSVLEKLLQKLQLESSENVENLRRGLIPDAPCPVCGATHHPYQEQRYENRALQELERQLEEAQENHFRLQNQAHDLLSNKKITEAEIQNLTQKEEESIVIQHQERKKISFLENDFIAKEHNLESLEKNIKVVLSDYQNNVAVIVDKIADYQGLKARETSLETRFNQALNQLESSNRKLNDSENASQKLVHRFDSAQRLLESAQNMLTEKEQSVNQLLDNPSWFLLWKNTPEQFANRLKKAVNDWQQSQENLRLGEQSQLSINQNILHLSQQQLDQAKQLEDLKTLYDREVQLLSEMKLERQNLLEGKNADQVERQINDKLKIVQKQIELHLTNYQKNALDFQEISTKKQTQEQFLAQLKQERETLQERIEHWMIENPDFKADLNTQKFDYWISLDNLWVHQERLQLKQLEEGYLMAQTLLKDRSDSLKRHQNQNIPEQSQSDCERLLAENKESEAKVRQDIGKLHNQWAVHQKEVEKHQDLLRQREEKQQVLSQWEVINSLIGSSSGKVFQRYAQEFTLDTLLRYANVHLSSINQRYQLERISDTLSLQVIDKEMGYEVRSVYSLSGGESFLVSLGLALALSSLSSTKMNIETLFIDEGFGTLDAKTLAIAMDALESLQHQGKKVGVISHVQEMTERIAVKIEVKKQGNGKSSIQIKNDW
ncbi:SbcC/MukB-like Walker B domain-containing protein [Capnocytophaga canimorsus]|uniref:SbcC/MukB-like Walker B domain-containing protein n=1 Tax=Capnocytophaga canimorsus TaxID=28188 RepID=UPI003851136E